MKNKFVIIILLFVLIAGGVAAYFYYFQKPLNVEDVLPPQPLFYLKASNVQQNMKDLLNSKFVAELKTIDYDKIASNTNMQVKPSEVFAEINQKLSDPNVKTVLEEFFGREFAVTIYSTTFEPGVISELTPSNILPFVEDVASNLYLVMRLKPKAQAAEMLASIFSQGGPNIAKEKVEYKNHTINSYIFTNVNVKISYAVIKDLMVVGFGEEAIKKCLDIYIDRKESLKKDEQFIKAQNKYFASPDMIVYFNMAKGFGLLEEIARAGVKEDPGSVDLAFKNVKGLNTFGISMKRDSLLKFNSILFIDQSQLDPETAQLYTCPASQNQSIKFIPQNSIGYMWTNCFKLNYIWSQLKKEIDLIQQQRTAKAEGEVENFNPTAIADGIIQNEIIPIVGEEIGGYLTDVNITDIFPMPKIVLFFKTLDITKLNEQIAKLKVIPVVQFNEENYNGVNIQYVTTPLGEKLQPSFCLIDDYFLVGINTLLIKSSIDAYKNETISLKNNPDYKLVNLDLAGNNRMVQFVEVADIVERIEQIIDWGNRWIEEKNESNQAFKSGAEQRLKDVEASMVSANEELIKLKADAEALKKKIADLEVQVPAATPAPAQGVTQSPTPPAAVDVSAQKTELGGLEQKITDKEIEIKGYDEQKQELEQLIVGYSRTVIDPQQQKIVLESLIKPILNALKTIQAFSFKTTYEAQSFVSDFYLKMK